MVGPENGAPPPEKRVSGHQAALFFFRAWKPEPCTACGGAALAEVRDFLGQTGLPSCHGGARVTGWGFGHFSILNTEAWGGGWANPFCCAAGGGGQRLRPPYFSPCSIAARRQERGQKCLLGRWAYLLHCPSPGLTSVAWTVQRWTWRYRSVMSETSSQSAGYWVCEDFSHTSAW